jgi:hypothetical protein
MKRIRRFVTLAAPLIGVVVLLASCVGIDEKVTVNSDGSGQVDLTYRVSKMISQLGAPEGTSKPIPLPVTGSDFRNAVQSVPGLSLQEYSTDQTAQDNIVKATIGFANVASLSKLLDTGADQSISLTTGGGHSTFREVIFPGSPKGVDPDTLSLLKGAFAGYKLDFSLTAPVAITSANVGAISKDGKTATYNTSVVDVVQSKQPVVWEVTW